MKVMWFLWDHAILWLVDSSFFQTSDGKNKNYVNEGGEKKATGEDQSSC